MTGKRVTLVIIAVMSGLLHVACDEDATDSDPTAGTGRRQEMRTLVQTISAWAKGQASDFIVVPQNGHELATSDGEEGGSPAADYLAAIDGAGQEDLFYGYVSDNLPTPPEQINHLLSFLQLYEQNGVEVLVTDYCSDPVKVDDSHARNSALEFISLAADHRELDNLPAYPAAPHDTHDADVTNLAGARNFLYLLNSGRFADRESYLQALDTPNFDLLILDLFYQDVMLTPTEVTELQTKPGGGRRLLLCYMSIGQAEDYRDYWQQEWSSNPPSWLLSADPEWPGNYDVNYWHADWQAILFGADRSYLQRIIDAGFDGVYLDKIDTFEIFE